MLTDGADKSHVGNEVVYFNGNASALGTTRSAYPLATALAAVRYFGMDKLRQLAHECQDKATNLAKAVESLGLTLFSPVASGVVPIALSGADELEYYKSSLLQEGYKVSPIIIPSAKGDSYGIRVVVTPKKEMTQRNLDGFVKALRKTAQNSPTTTKD